ncbi:cupin domain-containing protein [Ideonella sp. B7]|uniref:JmjC domain-containing protein n=1 Tax=Ideonella benzenivorans TaxID=2831643 RepID=UPI001CEC5D61|nr:cupin domain-containing protein [Ideonella benzenivorans]MCA6216181.1 cupin domain-containing protein [Ideonella benzenivorans]
MTVNPLQKLPLLGGLSPAQFMRRYWQKKPCLIRQAVPGVVPPVDRAELLALAARDDVESRLVQQAKGGWQLRHGPFSRRQIPPFSRPGWTLLVQGLDLHVQAAHEMLSQFRFVPEARLDDLMISYASDGGGVGPHLDSYDVFLLQVSGRRRWRVGPVRDSALVEDMPVKLLAHFEPTEEWVLEPGDMLYLPPRWGHDGIAEGHDCMTCSVGFRTPTPTETARDVLQRMIDALEAPEHEPHYRDPAQSATDTPGRIPPALQEFAQQAVISALNDAHSLACALGESLTEPKAIVWFEGGEPLQEGQGLRLDRRTRMMYDERHVFINGESFRAAGRDARLMQQLADQHTLGPREVRQLSAGARELVDDWAEAGWLHGV